MANKHILVKLITNLTNQVIIFKIYQVKRKEDILILNSILKDRNFYLPMKRLDNRVVESVGRCIILLCFKPVTTLQFCAWSKLLYLAGIQLSMGLLHFCRSCERGTLLSTTYFFKGICRVNSL